jgi:hypothetical protein
MDTRGSREESEEGWDEEVLVFEDSFRDQRGGRVHCQRTSWDMSRCVRLEMLV